MHIELPDPATGHVNVSNGVSVVLTPGMQEHIFLSSKIGQPVSPFVSNPPCVAYRLQGGFELAGHHWGAIAYFEAGMLRRISLYIAQDGSAGWDDWSEDFERERQREHEDVLRQRYGRSSSLIFAWGTISATYDPRGAASDITISYV